MSSSLVVILKEKLNEIVFFKQFANILIVFIFYLTKQMDI